MAERVREFDSDALTVLLPDTERVPRTLIDAEEEPEEDRVPARTVPVTETDTVPDREGTTEREALIEPEALTEFVATTLSLAVLLSRALTVGLAEEERVTLPDRVPTPEADPVPLTEATTDPVLLAVLPEEREAVTEPRPLLDGEPELLPERLRLSAAVAAAETVLLREPVADLELSFDTDPLAVDDRLRTLEAEEETEGEEVRVAVSVRGPVAAAELVRLPVPLREAVPVAEPLRVPLTEPDEVPERVLEREAGAEGVPLAEPEWESDLRAVALPEADVVADLDAREEAEAVAVPDTDLLVVAETVSRLVPVPVRDDVEVAVPVREEVAVLLEKPLDVLVLLAVAVLDTSADTVEVLDAIADLVSGRLGTTDKDALADMVDVRVLVAEAVGSVLKPARARPSQLRMAGACGASGSVPAPADRPAKRAKKRNALRICVLLRGPSSSGLSLKRW